MELRPLGCTGLQVSAIALGTVKLGRNRGVKYPEGEGFKLPNDAEAAALFRCASENGVTFVDTAPAYGASEDRIGQLMSQNAWFSRGRAGWILGTKVGEEFDPESGTSRFDFSPSGVRSSVERSLRRLRVDEIDLVLLHCGEHDDWTIMHSGAMETLRDLKRAGKVRAIGASTKSVDGGLAAVRSSMGACDVVMVTYNPRDRADEIVIDAAHRRGVGVLVKKALLSGHVGTIGSRLPADLREEPDGASAALRFALRRTGVTSVVVGTTSVNHLTHAAAIAHSIKAH